MQQAEQCYLHLTGICAPNGTSLSWVVVHLGHNIAPLGPYAFRDSLVWWLDEGGGLRAGKSACMGAQCSGGCCEL